MVTGGIVRRDSTASSSFMFIAVYLPSRNAPIIQRFALKATREGRAIPLSTANPNACDSVSEMELPIILLPGEDGYVVAECPVIPGCISQGKTREEALRNIREAIELCLENRASEGWDLPDDYEIVQVSVGD
jgi:predicted RNase H-like HicB family nuclease